MQPRCVRSVLGDRIPCLITVRIEVIAFSISAKSTCGMKLLFHVMCFCIPVQSCVPWTAAATVCVQEESASVRRAGWDPPVRSAPAIPTALSTGSAKMGSVSAAPDGKGTTAPLVRGICTSVNKMNDVLTSFAKICQGHQDSRFRKTQSQQSEWHSQNGNSTVLLFRGNSTEELTLKKKTKKQKQPHTQSVVV